MYYVSEEQARSPPAHALSPCHKHSEGAGRCGAASGPPAAQAKLAAGMPRKQLIGFGTAFGKFTKTKQFRLHVTCLDYVAQHAQHDSSCNRSSTGPREPEPQPEGAPKARLSWRLSGRRLRPLRWALSCQLNLQA